MLDLKCRVREAEAVAQDSLELAADPVAVGPRLDEHVRRERRKPRGDRPDVEVVDVHDCGNGAHRPPELSRVEALGSALEQDPD